LSPLLFQKLIWQESSIAAKRIYYEPALKKIRDKMNTTARVVFYHGSWYFGQPSIEELRQDLRQFSRKCRPDWDIATPR
jgi:hypothetical protein